MSVFVGNGFLIQLIYPVTMLVLSPSLKLPAIYDKRYKINFSVLDSDLSRKLKDYRRGERKDRDQTHHRSHHSRDIDSGIDADRIDEFRMIIKHYLHFCQRQKFEKLVRIRQAQATLPIRQYRDQIIEAVKTHQVVIIAGDTGCGKSTQACYY